MLDALNKKMGTPQYDIAKAGTLVEDLTTARNIYLNTSADVKRLTTQHKILNNVAKSSGTLEAFKAQAKAADNILQRRIEGKDAELKSLALVNATKEQREAFENAEEQGREALTKFLSEETDLNEKITKQIGERLELLAQEKTEQQITFENEVARVEGLKAQLDVQSSSTENSVK
jgi:hypothetical protein